MSRIVACSAAFALAFMLALPGAAGAAERRADALTARPAVQTELSSVHRYWHRHRVHVRRHWWVRRHFWGPRYGFYPWVPRYAYYPYWRPYYWRPWWRPWGWRWHRRRWW